MACTTCMRLRREAADAIKQGDAAKVAQVAKQATTHSLRQVIEKLKGARR